jgi:hypothetical protein
VGPARPGVTVAAPARATDADLELVHDPGYIAVAPIPAIGQSATVGRGH